MRKKLPPPPESPKSSSEQLSAHEFHIQDDYSHTLESAIALATTLQRDLAKLVELLKRGDEGVRLVNGLGVLQGNGVSLDVKLAQLKTLFDLKESMARVRAAQQREELT